MTKIVHSFKNLDNTKEIKQNIHKKVNKDKENQLIATTCWVRFTKECDPFIFLNKTE